MRYTIKDNFGNSYDFSKEELVEAARAGKIEANATIYDNKRGARALAQQIPAIKAALDYYEQKKETEVREKERQAVEKERAKVEREERARIAAELAAEAERAKIREEQEEAIRKLQEEVKRQAERQAAEAERERQRIIDEYGSVEIGEKIKIVQNNACSWVPVEKLILSALSYFGVLLLCIAVVSGVALGIFLGVVRIDEESGAKLAIYMGGPIAFCAVVSVIMFPFIFTLYKYSELTGKRQAAMIQLNELYERARRIRESREKNA